MKTEVRCYDWNFPIENFKCSDEFSIRNFICENLEEFDKEHKMLVSTFAGLEALIRVIWLKVVFYIKFVVQL